MTGNKHEPQPLPPVTADSTEPSPAHGAVTTAQPTAHRTGLLQPLPETVQFTADTISAWRKAGYRVSEQRKASWLYLVARSSFESAVYKLVGPRFAARGVVYDGRRIA